MLIIIIILIYSTHSVFFIVIAPHSGLKICAFRCVRRVSTDFMKIWGVWESIFVRPSPTRARYALFILQPYTAYVRCKSRTGMYGVCTRIHVRAYVSRRIKNNGRLSKIIYTSKTAKKKKKKQQQPTAGRRACVCVCVCVLK